MFIRLVTIVQCTMSWTDRCATIYPRNDEDSEYSTRKITSNCLERPLWNFKSAKPRLRPGLCQRPDWRSLQRSPDPLVMGRVWLLPLQESHPALGPTGLEVLTYPLFVPNTFTPFRRLLLHAVAAFTVIQGYHKFVHSPTCVLILTKLLYVTLQDWLIDWLIQHTAMCCDLYA